METGGVKPGAFSRAAKMFANGMYILKLELSVWGNKKYSYLYGTCRAFVTLSKQLPDPIKSYIPIGSWVLALTVLYDAAK